MKSSTAIFSVPQPRAVIIIAPAMGVKQVFYRDIADYYNSLAYAVITLDTLGCFPKGE